MISMTDPNQPAYKVVPFTRLRQVVADSARIGHRKHLTHGLIEVDVTVPRHIIRVHKEHTGERLSFSAFIISCLGFAVGENTAVQAYRNWRNQLIIFDDVDISTIFESKLEGELFPFAHIIRAANRRPYREIHDEIRSIQSDPYKSPGTSKADYLKVFYSLPTFIRDIIFRIALKNPHFIKANFGTVGLTAVGMFGEGSGWGIALPLYNLALVVGGIGEKPGIVDGRIEIREYLSLTVSIDHDILDGAPAARFVTRLKELIESGHGLSDVE
jgi:pyruvate/2-oxoglutarate dehydrogenase complex dihydrolipoamide acyltransferase (E2) component